jgi:lipoprotein NlpI
MKNDFFNGLRGLIKIFAILVLFLPIFLAAADKSEFDTLLARSKAAYDSGKRDEAVTLATQAIKTEPENPQGYFFRARLYEETRQPAKAVADYDEVINLEPLIPEAWHRRGSENFKLGQIKESIADFDRFIELAPQREPYHWQRGIAFYYADRFEDGRKQFELHQTVNSNDVENAVWHFLCVARQSGVERARASLIHIKGDSRVPMKEVHALFAGKAKPEDVLKAASESASETKRNEQLFYAHLYLGLYFEAIGTPEKAREHIALAAEKFQTNDYMGDVARIHLQLRWPKKNVSPTKEAK